MCIRDRFNKTGYGFSSIEKKLLEDNTNLIYFISPNLRSQGLSNIPYIFTLWDLGHLEMPEFPEVSYDRRFELREFIYNRSLKKAINVIVDSEYSKQYTIKKYNPESIIHLAALQVPFCAADPTAGAKVNVVGTVNIMEAAKQNEEKFFVKQFFDSMNAIGNIPVSLAKWEMTGDSSQIDKIKKTNSELEY